MNMMGNQNINMMGAMGMPNNGFGGQSMGNLGVAEQQNF
jgi:hypothetical protein